MAFYIFYGTVTIFSDSEIPIDNMAMDQYL